MSQVLLSFLEGLSHSLEAVLLAFWRRTQSRLPLSALPTGSHGKHGTNTDTLCCAIFSYLGIPELTPHELTETLDPCMLFWNDSII